MLASKHKNNYSKIMLESRVSIVLEGFETLPLPVPVSAFDRNILTDAVGSFVQWPISLVRFQDDQDEAKENEGNQKENRCAEVLGSNSHHSKLSTTPIKAPTREIMVESLSPDCQLLNTLISITSDEETFNICFDANLFYNKEDNKIEVHKNDLKQFLDGSELNISIIQIFTRALRDDLMKLNRKPHIGWLCPEATSDSKLRKKAEDTIAYVTSAFQKSVLNGDEFILAPIIDSKHWVLLAICPKTYTIYEFDSINLTKRRKLYMSMVVLSALKRYKMSGGEIKIKRIEPLWKSVKCLQQSGSVECGYYVMRFMYDIVQTCSTTSDLEKVWNSQREEPYTDSELNELRDKWAMYFTSRCVN